MRPLRAAPLALPAAGFWAGLALVPQDPAAGWRWSVPLLVLLALAAAALRGRAGTLCLWLVLGCLRGLIAPVSMPPAGFEPDRAVSARVAVVGDWRERDDRASVRVRIEVLRQGGWIHRTAIDGWLSVPGGGRPEARVLRVKGFLGRSPPRRNGPDARAGGWRLRVPSWQLVRVEEEMGTVGRLGLAARERVAAVLEASPRPGAALARSLLLGRSDHLPDELHRALGRAGVSHVLALSGLHVGFLVFGAYLGLGWLPRGPRWALATASAFAYLLLAGPRPALIRATVMALGVGASLLARRNPSPLNALALAALGLLVCDPPAAASLGFRLTVSATAGLLLLAPLLTERWRTTALGRRLPPLVVLSPAAGVAAQLATLPWIGPVLAGWSPLAPLTNLLAVPWAAGALALSWLWLAADLSPLPPLVASTCLDLLGLWLTPVEWAAARPAGPWWFVPLAWGGVAWTLACGVTARLCLRGSRRAFALTALVLLAWAGWSGHRAARRPAELVALDVGQGDAVLLRRGRRAVLVDGGGLRGGLHRAGGVLVPALARLGVRRLDAVVMTHPDADHCGGLPGLAAWLPVGEVWTGPGWRGQPCADTLYRAPGARVRELTAGDRLALGDALTFEVLYPRATEPLAREVNDRSLVLRAVLGRPGGPDGFSVLLTGDVGRLVEERLVARHGEGLRSDVLKVAHHGSRNSSAARFLAAAGARWAVVSAGAGNPYGHPHPQTLQRLETAGSGTLSTHHHGQIRLVAGAPVFYSYFAMRPVH